MSFRAINPSSCPESSVTTSISAWQESKVASTDSIVSAGRQDGTRRAMNCRTEVGPRKVSSSSGCIAMSRWSNPSSRPLGSTTAKAASVELANFIRADTIVSFGPTRTLGFVMNRCAFILHPPCAVHASSPQCIGGCGSNLCRQCDDSAEICGGPVNSIEKTVTSGSGIS